MVQTVSRLLKGAALAVVGGILGAQSPASACDELPFLGDMCVVPYSFCPTGTLPADGRTLQIQQNQQLWAVLGTRFGGDGRTTFALPDMRGRVGIGMGTGPGLPPYQVGDKGGLPAVTRNSSQVAAHSHTIVAQPVYGTWNLFGTSEAASAASPSGAILAAPRISIYAASGPLMTLSAASATVTNASISGVSEIAGTENPIENRSPFLALNFCIATQGLPHEERGKSSTARGANTQ